MLAEQAGFISAAQVKEATKKEKARLFSEGLNMRLDVLDSKVSVVMPSHLGRYRFARDLT